MHLWKKKFNVPQYRQKGWEKMRVNSVVCVCGCVCKHFIDIYLIDANKIRNGNQFARLCFNERDNACNFNFISKKTNWIIARIGQN